MIINQTLKELFQSVWNIQKEIREQVNLERFSALLYPSWNSWIVYPSFSAIMDILRKSFLERFSSERKS